MKKKLLILLLTLLLNVQQGFSSGFFKGWWKGKQFSTMNDLKTYARSVNEFPTIDNNDYMNPNYETFYRSLNDGFFRRSWDKVKGWWPTTKSYHWSSAEFERLLKSVTQARVNNLRQGVFIEKITPAVGAEFAIWSSLHGAYHSLVRELDELKNKNVISEDLKIIKPNYYFVFNGNVVNLSPFSMETLLVVLMLMERNPEKVFFIKGLHESEISCSKHGFWQELQWKLKKTKHFVTFQRLLNDFFNTLPLALFLRQTADSVAQFIQVANGSAVYRWGEEAHFSDFLKTPDYGRAQVFKLTKKSGIAAPELPVDLYIDAENGFHSLADSKGLRRISQEEGVPTWGLFSGQTGAHRAMREFFYDSFVVFSINEVFYRSTLSLYARDTRTNKGFEQTTYLAFPKVLPRRG